MATNKNIENITDEMKSPNQNAGQVNVNIEKKLSTPKRTRLSHSERVQKESEELVRNMGGTLVLDGGRRTRSSARGTPTRTPEVDMTPPSKKARTLSNREAVTPRRRGRARKLIDVETATADTNENTPSRAPSTMDTDMKETCNTTNNVRNIREQNDTKILVNTKLTDKDNENEIEMVCADDNKLKGQEQECQKEMTILKNMKEGDTTLLQKDIEQSDDKILTQEEQQEKEQDVLSSQQSGSVDTPDSKFEETSSQMNVDQEKIQLMIEEVPEKDNVVRNDPESTVQIEKTTESNILSKEFETPEEQQLPQAQMKSLSAATDKKTVTSIEDEESMENVNDAPDFTDNEPLDVDSSSKSDDVVEIIGSDNNSCTGSENNAKDQSAKDKDNCHAITDSSPSLQLSVENKLNERVTPTILNSTKGICGLTSVANVDTADVASTERNVLKTDDYDGDSKMGELKTLETCNSNILPASSEEHENNKDDSDKSESGPSAPDATTATASAKKDLMLSQTSV